jgi:hypothetical protein
MVDQGTVVTFRAQFRSKEQVRGRGEYGREEGKEGEGGRREEEGGGRGKVHKQHGGSRDRCNFQSSV